LSAQHGAVTKLLIILLTSAALASGLSPKSDPPLLIDSQPAPVSLDANN
jgi:hypothetical protein